MVFLKQENYIGNMKLTTEEKELITLIGSDKIQSFYDFWVKEFVKVENLKVTQSDLSTKGTEINGVYYFFIRNKTYFGIDDRSKRIVLYEEMIRFIRIIQTMEHEKLIFSFSAETTAYPAILFKAENGKYVYDGYVRTNRLIWKYKDLLLFRTPSLDLFIDNGFRTQSEVTRDEELQHRNKSHNLTLKVAIGSIIVSLLATIFNIFLSNKNREVHITNPGPTEIRITNLDSLKQTIQLQLRLDTLKNEFNSEKK